MSKVDPGSGLGRGKGRAPIYDRDEMVRLYRDKRMTIAQVADKMGIPYMAAYRGLSARGVLVRGGKKTGRPRQKTCAKGHDQLVWRREDNRGRGFCGKCKTERDKGYKK